MLILGNRQKLENFWTVTFNIFEIFNQSTTTLNNITTLIFYKFLKARRLSNKVNTHLNMHKIYFYIFEIR